MEMEMEMEMEMGVNVDVDANSNDNYYGNNNNNNKQIDTQEDEISTDAIPDIYFGVVDDNEEVRRKASMAYVINEFVPAHVCDYPRRTCCIPCKQTPAAVYDPRGEPMLPYNQSWLPSPSTSVPSDSIEMQLAMPIPVPMQMQVPMPMQMQMQMPVQNQVFTIVNEVSASLQAPSKRYDSPRNSKDTYTCPQIHELKRKMGNEVQPQQQQQQQQQRQQGCVDQLYITHSWSPSQKSPANVLVRIRSNGDGSGNGNNGENGVNNGYIGYNGVCGDRRDVNGSANARVLRVDDFCNDSNSNSNSNDDMLEANEKSINVKAKGKGKGKSKKRAHRDKI
ncbi:hypothetical protein RFI_09676 [Reticulomyxa filosa]|uniref:Uncharacterized protein n=1 Tax=Reticulomyxa filosa TaxID=46433 RepID=X6NQ24_RETFI|nr:hypothetical protein RFI_09676 [Reticulomyxa filosa]|eukprot:ETO27457.1 hypothetical protein RFI_09676 [Reticulomyxa filosa]